MHYTRGPLWKVDLHGLRKGSYALEQTVEGSFGVGQWARLMKASQRAAWYQQRHGGHRCGLSPVP